MMTPPDPGLTLLHFGDLHLWRIGLDADPRFKRLLGLANLLLRRGRLFPLSIARLVLRRIEHDPADYLCFSGDLTTTSLKAEFEDARRLLLPLLDKWQARFLAIPGNHDRYTVRAAGRRYYETLFAGEHARFPFEVDLDAVWTLIGIDCSVPRRFTSRGRFTREARDALAPRLAEHRRRGRRLIVMGHYPLLYPARVPVQLDHALPERMALFELLAEHRVDAYLHGHKHQRWRLKHEGVTLLNCGSAGMDHPRHRPGYLRIQLTHDGIGAVQSVSLRHRADIVREARREARAHEAAHDHAPPDTGELPAGEWVTRLLEEDGGAVH